MTRGIRLLVVVLALVIAGASLYAFKWRTAPHPGPGAVSALTGPPHAPAGVRIRVQVLNTTRIRGLARRATKLLRDRGFDVVEMGTAGPLRDTTLVLDRSGHADWAAAVAKIMGPSARSEARSDSSRYLDITVLLGSAWRAPTQPFDP